MHSSNSIYEALALYEHLQISNWNTLQDIPNSRKISDAISETLNWLFIMAENREVTLDTEMVLKFHSYSAQKIGVNTKNVFHDKQGWEKFLEQTVGLDDHPLNTRNIADTEAWILATLHWDHLSSLRLVVPWLFISALDIQNGNHGFGLCLSKLGSLLNHLSDAGPDLFDAEMLRANIRNYI